MCGSDIFLGLIAVLFPPLPVWIKRGICSADSFINIGLCCLGFLPGLLHAWYIIAKYPDLDFEYAALQEDPEIGQGAVVTYYYVNHRPSADPTLRPATTQPGYGTNAPMPRMSNQPGAHPSQDSDPQRNTQDPEEGGSRAVPPSYQEAVGDHKLQS